MKPEHGPRRAIIREWMTLPQGERRTAQQAAAFAATTATTHPFRCSRDRYQTIMGWLLPRTGRA